MAKSILASLWIGTCVDLIALRRYVAHEYTEDGDALPSGLERDFGLDWIDDDMIEVERLSNETESLSELLKGCSFEDKILPAFVSISGEKLSSPSNAMILVLERKFIAKVRRVRKVDVSLELIGSVHFAR